jgi:Phosphotransferase enzyme family
LQSFAPDLDLLRQALGPHVQDCHTVLIKTTLPWSLVFRVTLVTSQGHSMPESVILKATNPNGPSDPREAVRESQFYKSIYPKLNLPKPQIHHLGRDEESGWNLMIMEDLSSTHRIPEHPYQWTRSELRSVLHAYALFHSAAPLPGAGDRQWLNPRHETELEFDEIPAQVETIQNKGIWGPLPGLSRLISQARASCLRFERMDICLLHNDTTPTNAPLPRDLASQPATLIDWQDAGIGMAEMDLAYLDLQPFDSARAIPRMELLNTYWQIRRELGDEAPGSVERAERQLHADLIMSLWLVRPGSRVALQPYPEGTYPHMHWNSHFGVIYKRLLELTHEIPA